MTLLTIVNEIFEHGKSWLKRKQKDYKSTTDSKACPHAPPPTSPSHTSTFESDSSAYPGIFFALLS